MTEEDKRKQWFAVHVLAGQESKVQDNLVKRIKTEEMSDFIYEVLVPTERVSEIKRGKKSETVRKLMPGYVIVNMWLIDENKQLVDKTWYFIRETTGVIGFAGTKDRPIPMRKKEVESLLAQVREREDSVKPKISFEVGDKVNLLFGEGAHLLTIDRDSADETVLLQHWHHKHRPYAGNLDCRYRQRITVEVGSALAHVGDLHHLPGLHHLRQGRVEARMDDCATAPLLDVRFG